VGGAAGAEKCVVEVRGIPTWAVCVLYLPFIRLLDAECKGAGVVLALDAHGDWSSFRGCALVMQGDCRSSVSGLKVLGQVVRLMHES
jgi:hypothetical protein